MRAVYPAFVKIRDGASGLLWGFVTVAGIVILVVVPTAVGIACLSNLIVQVVLGAKWSAAAPLLRILVILGALQACRAIIDPVLMATGKPRAIATRSAAFVFTGIPLFALLLWRFNLTTATWGLVVGGLVSVVLGFTVALEELHGRWSLLLATTVRPLIASGVMAAVVIGCRALFPPPGGSVSALPELLVLILVGAASYTACVLGLWRIVGSPDGAERTLLELLAQFLAKLRRRSSEPVES